LPGAKVFRVPGGLLDIFNNDLAFAGIPKTINGESNCLHSLRHSFASMLALAGVSPQKATKLLRHHSLDLTMQRYTHIELDDKASAVATLPDISSYQGEQAQKTGTDDQNTEVTAEVTGNRQKVGKTGKDCQTGLRDDEQAGLIKPCLHANNGDNENIGWQESKQQVQCVLRRLWQTSSLVGNSFT
jgi:hypothetical protein